MAVKRIVANIAAQNIEQAATFYSGILGLNLAMDLGWIQTFSSDNRTTPQVSIAMEGGSGAAVPDLSIEIDNLDEVINLLSEAGMAIVYGPTTEPWGVRRLFVRDPFNRLVNLLEHV